MTAVVYTDTGIVDASYEVSTCIQFGAVHLPPSAIPINSNPRGLSWVNVQASELDYLDQSTG